MKLKNCRLRAGGDRLAFSAPAAGALHGFKKWVKNAPVRQSAALGGVCYAGIQAGVLLDSILCNQPVMTPNHKAKRNCDAANPWSGGGSAVAEHTAAEP